MDKYPLVWVEKLSNGRWCWFVGPQRGDDKPTFKSVEDFDTEWLAKEDAEYTLSSRGMPFVTGPGW